MTAAETDKVIATLKAAYQATSPRLTLQPETVRLYARMLEDLAAEDVLRALQVLIATSEFFPSVAAIRKAVVEVRAPAPPAEVEWRKVLEKASGRAHEPWGPFTQAAVDAVGWDEIRLSETVGVQRRWFMDAYSAIVESGQLAENVGRLRPRTGPISAGAAVAGLLKEGGS